MTKQKHRKREYVHKSAQVLPPKKEYVHLGRVIDADALLNQMPPATQWAVAEYSASTEVSHSVLAGIHEARRHGFKWYQVAAVFDVDLRTAKRWGELLRRQIADALAKFDVLQFVGDTLCYYRTLSHEAWNEFHTTCLGTPVADKDEFEQDVVSYVVHGPSGRHRAKMLKLAMEARDREAKFLLKLGVLDNAKALMTQGTRIVRIKQTNDLDEIRQAVQNEASDEELEALVYGYSKTEEPDSVFHFLA